MKINKKLYVKTAVIAAAAAAAGYYGYTSQNGKMGASNLLDINIEALAGDPFPCPNGCLDEGSGCFCHYYFPSYREAGM